MRIKIFSVVSILSWCLIFVGSVAAQTDLTKQIPQPPPAIKEQRDLIIKNRLEAKEKFKTIRDEKKRAMVERIDEKIYIMNKTHTARFSAALEKLLVILNRITLKTQNAKSKGFDTSTIDSAIATAKSAIDAAKAAVSTQSAKTYSIEVTGEATSKTTVGSVVSMFRKDLRDVHKLVVDAKQAVQKAEKELATFGGKQKEKVGEKAEK